MVFGAVGGAVEEVHGADDERGLLILILPDDVENTRLVFVAFALAHACRGEEKSEIFWPFHAALLSLTVLAAEQRFPITRVALKRE